MSRTVAPVRERGLKSDDVVALFEFDGRSREGAWIEIYAETVLNCPTNCRSREGAWIEIKKRA